MTVVGSILWLFIICGLQSTTAFFFNKPFHAIVTVRNRNLFATTTSTDADILRKVENWGCVKNCGACCKLGPLDSRPDLQSYLTEDQYKLFISMIGPDDWCKHFDKENRLCTIYENRPEFCRVDKQNFKKMFDIDEDEFSVSHSHIVLFLKSSCFLTYLTYLHYRISVRFVAVKTLLMCTVKNRKKWTDLRT